ncbi:MAG: hypothetical protein RL169_799, partial [Armatimonadota bacterium]
MSIPTIPVLRKGVEYASYDHVELKSVRTGDVIARVAQANAALIKRDLRRLDRSSLADFTVTQLVEMTKEAGRHYMESTLPVGDQQQTPEDYIHQLSETSGLPHSLVRRNMAKIHQVFTEMETILAGLSRGLSLDVLDKLHGQQNGIPVAYFPTASFLAVVLPSNSPGVNSLWMPSIALKTPLVLKPGREEPWTPLRIIQSFIAAGVPAEAFSFYPTDHEGSGALMDASTRALIFGDVSTVQKYASNPGVEVHGPGWSKIIIGNDCIENWREYIDVIATSISANGGRSCINASTVVVPKYGREIADAIATKVAEVFPRGPEDPEAILSGFANPRMAEMMDAAIDAGLQTAGAVDCSADKHDGPRKVDRDGCTYLHPTILFCSSWDHPMAGKEYMFPFAQVIETPQSEMLEKMGQSLIVTAITNDDAFLQEIMACPHIDRLNVGALPTSHV